VTPLALGLELILGVTALALLIPVTVIFAEIVLALAYDERSATIETGDRRRLAVLVPAHDEASIIASTLRSVVPQLTQNDTLLVVADNCSDETAAVATKEGAEVIVRSDPLRRGKGYALDYGVRHLERGGHGPPDVVVIVDADCQISFGAIDRLSRMCARTLRPVQAMYLMHAAGHAAGHAGIRMRIAEFAWMIKNKVRPLGLHYLGLPCQLMGTGMAFPWSCLSTADLASGHIVEDMQLGVDFALAGSAPLFCPGALVTSTFPSSEQGIASQRVRWEHGHLGVIVGETTHLIALALRRFNGALLVFALDLCVPPIALLVLLLTTVWSASAALYFFLHVRVPIAISTFAFLLLALGISLAWRKYGRHILSLGDLVRAGTYVFWKIPLYARFLAHRQSEWVRSKRDDDSR
jgi:cellulose synthase/poly-beta-1,6-N-acetylglucosamine synthase-like glycosyltransferase